MIHYNFDLHRVEGVASVEIKRKKEFKLTRLLSSGDVRHSFQLRPPYTWDGLAVNDLGQLAFVGSLDGLVTGLLLYENGRFDLAASAGTPTLEPGGVISRFGPPAMNNRGQVLSVYGSMARPGGLLLADRGGSLPLLQEGQSVGGLLNLNGFQITRHSLNDSGEILLRAGFNVRRNSDEYATALFRFSQGFPELVWRFDRALPGFEDAFGAYSFGIDGAATAYFLANAGSADALYRARRSSRPEKIMATGDDFAGAAVESIGDLAVAEDGDVAFPLYLDNGDQRVVWLSGDQTASLPVRDPGRVFSVSKSAGVLFEGNAGRGQGLYRWDGDTATPMLLLGRLGPNEEPIRQIDGAAMNSQGRVFAQVRTAENDFVVLEPGGPTPLLFQAGDPVNVTSNLSLHSRSLISGSGSGSGPARVLVGYPGSVFEVGRQGPIPRLILGDRLPQGSGFAGADYAAEDSSGNLYMLLESGLLRLTSGRVETVLPRELRSDDGLSIYLNQFTVNDNGVVLFSAHTERGYQALYLWRNSRIELLATDAQQPEEQTSSPAGGTFLYWGEFSVDDRGRVMAYFDVRGGPSGYFLFDNGQWQPAALAGERIGGVAVSHGHGLRALDDKFYATFFSAQCCNEAVLAEYRESAWTPLITSENALPRGELAEAGLGGLFDVNRRGEIAFSIHSNVGEALVLRSPDGQTRIVQITGEQTSAGDLPWSFREVDLRDDGRLYFTALDLNDRVSLYLAELPSAPPVPKRLLRVPARSRARGR